MTQQFHGKMHELSSGLMSLAHKMNEQKARLDDIEKVSKEYDENLREQISINSHITACNEYIKKVSTQIQEISNMEDDIEVTCKKAEGEKCSVCWKISKTSCEKHGHLTN